MKSFLTLLQGIALALLAFLPASSAADSMTTAASITDARMVHNAALLPDGRVLVVGGSTVFNPALGTNPTLTGQVATAQVFDPQSGSWTSVTAPASARKLAAMSVLPNGKVFLAGGMVANGFGGSWPSGTGVIYDPASGTWGDSGVSVAGGGQHTGTMLADGGLLIAGGDTRSCLIYNSSTGVGSTTGSLNDLRSSHTATLLPNGKVLVDGGLNDFPVYNTELYDPAAGTWTRVASSNVQRFFHSATLLPSGKVLVVGGLSNYPSSGQILSQAQLYDPAANTWMATGSLNSARYGHSATLLPNGKVAVIGGLGASSTLSSVEIYDPAAGTWSTSTASLATARKFHTATLLTDGRVVIVGGSSSADAALASVEIFTSSSPAWSATGAMGSARAYTQPVMLPDGKILVPGGYNGTDLSTADLYNPATGTWSSAGTMVSAHTEGTATLLPNGKVLLAGHSAPGNANKSELYDPVAGTWTALPNMPSSRIRHAATLLASGKVLITGGGLPAGLTASLLFDPSTNTWSTSGSLATGRLWHTATALTNGKVLVTGGTSQFTMDSFGSCELYDVAAGTWSSANAMGETRQRHSATLLPNGKVLVVGGMYLVGGITFTPRATAELFDPATGTWSSTGSLATARYDHRAELLPDGRVLVAGGTGTGAALSSTEIYNPATGTWSSGPVLSTGRTGAYLGLLTTGKVLIAGGTSGLAFSTPYLNTAELLDLGLGFNSAWQPQVSTASINGGRVLSVTGTALRGISGASSGGTQDSATDLPRVQLRSLGNAQIMWASPASSSATSFTSAALGSFAPGHMLMTVFTNGIPSESKVLTVPLGPEITVEQPVGTNIVDGGSQSFGSLTNGTSTPLTFTVKNSGDGALSLSGVSVTGGNASDFVVNSTGMSGSVAAGGSTTFTVTFTPSAVGSRSTTLQILSDDFDEATFDITLTGTGVNAAPTISDIADQTIGEDGNTGALSFTIGDFETAASSLTVTRSSSNTTLVPTANIVLGGTGSSRTVTVTPAANLSGTTIITVTVSDGTVSTSDTFNLTVNVVNDAPTLNAITNPAALPEDSGQQTVNLSGIGAGGGESQALTVTATSDNTALIPTPSVTYTSPNATGSVLYTPVANMSGTAIITVTVNDGQAANNTFSRTFTVTVNPVNDLPTLDPVSNPAAILEDAGLQTINLTGITAGPAESQTLVITATSNNTALIPHPTVSYTSPNTTGSLSYTPVANANGSATITVTVNDQQASNNTFSRTFTVTVNAVNDAPTISDITDQTINEDGNTGALAFTIGDVETAATSLTVTHSSSNTTLVPGANVVFGGSGASRTVTFTPSANQSGTAIITMTVSDGTTTTSDTFNLTVNAVNDPPTLNSITSPGAIQEDAVQQTVLLGGISAGPNESQTLTITATSNNTALIPNPTVSYTSPDTSGSVLYTPVANMSGTATITVTVNDGQAANNTFSRTFTVTVNPVNDLPTLDPVSNPAAILEDAGLQTINLTGITAGPSESQTLVITATSNNTALIPNPTVSYTSPNSTGSLSYTPVANANGSATITVTVNDQQASNNTLSRTFTVTVNAVNDAPTISDITDQTINEDGNTEALAFTIGDIETSVASLTVSLSSSDTTLVPTANIVLGGSGASRAITIVPAANRSGTALITVSVSDGTASTSETLLLTVNEVNDPPTLSLESPFTPPLELLEDSGMQTVSLFSISAGPLESQELVVTAVSSNPALIPHPTVNYTSPNSTGSLNFTPVPNASGSAVIHVTVNDQQASMNTVTRSFAVPVRDTADPPSGTDKTLTVPVGATHTFTMSDWGLSDPFDSPANGLSAVVFSSLPDSGLLRINGDAASSAQGAYFGWTPRGGSQSWQAIASSADGSRLAAVASGGQIHVSSDYGMTWTARESNRNWRAIASSADGSRLIAAAGGGQIYVSSDYGATWTARESNRPWTSVASSADGQRLAAVGMDTNIYVSADYGASWTPRFANLAWASVSCSADGSKIFATVSRITYPGPPFLGAQIEGGFYHSSNYGIDWNGVNESFATRPLVAASADGGSLASVVAPDTVFTIFATPAIQTSNDSGQTWIPRLSKPSSWTALATSAAGTKIFGTTWIGRINISNDQGNTWSEHESSRVWTAITSSADGSRVAAAVSGGQIYTFGGPAPVVTYQAATTPGSTSFTFQVQDAGDTANLDLTPNTMTINVVSAPDFWRHTHFGSTSNSGNGGDLADPDDDGIPNLLEYALGLHPGQNSAGQMPQAERNGGDLVYTFTEPAGVTGITYSAEWSETLQTGSWSSTGITHTVNNRVHTFTLPVGAFPGAFIRLRVTTP